MGFHTPLQFVTHHFKGSVQGDNLLATPVTCAAAGTKDDCDLLIYYEIKWTPTGVGDGDETSVDDGDGGEGEGGDDGEDGDDGEGFDGEDGDNAEGEDVDVGGGGDDGVEDEV